MPDIESGAASPASWIPRELEPLANVAARASVLAMNALVFLSTTVSSILLFIEAEVAGAGLNGRAGDDEVLADGAGPALDLGGGSPASSACGARPKR